VRYISPEEQVVRRQVDWHLVRLGVRSTWEATIVASKTPRRYRQVDLLVPLSTGDVWVEIDGENHRGKKNTRRDQNLAALARRRDARVIHVPLWRLLQEGVAGLVADIMNIEAEHLGRASGERYQTYHT